MRFRPVPRRALAALAALPLALGLALAGCSDSTTPVTPAERPPSALNIVGVKDPAFQDTSVSAWVKVGQQTELRLRFATAPGGDDRDFARLRIDKQSLLRRPDGMLFLPGDSVLITMRVADPTKLIAEFQPSGLQFNPAQPAQLEMHYDEASGDLNADGHVDSDDVTVENQLRIWRQETLTDPFVEVGGTLLRISKECRTPITGFTRYALAY